jgi:hypothetical protein
MLVWCSGPKSLGLGKGFVLGKWNTHRQMFSNFMPRCSLLAKMKPFLLVLVSHGACLALDSDG